MNKPQRGVYQPLMENIPVYDLSDEDVEEEERTSLPLLIVAALLAVAAFAGVVWLAYNQGVANGRESAAVVVAAPDGPARVAPSDSGGSPTPFTGLKVYEQPLAPDQEAQASALASAAEQEVSAAAPASDVVDPVPQIRPGSAAASPPTPAQAPAPARLAASASAAAVAGQAVLQIGAYESEDIANEAWTAFKSRHGAAAASLVPNIQRVDLGAKGVWYRLRAGPFQARGAAVSACEALRTQGANCFVTAP